MGKIRFTLLPLRAAPSGDLASYLSARGLPGVKVSGAPRLRSAGRGLVGRDLRRDTWGVGRHHRGSTGGGDRSPPRAL
ncbi:hypothetical protein JYU34_005492 [Plutella xylostella]|uniref:Uncharacterized protein n=1 Tax=Plutella xylostella TaxID=51655 RepID=A0ABQ7QWU6_PLUXY|nr:hypothetical protein JYU34_005492 [Plutella xylostella]